MRHAITHPLLCTRFDKSSPSVTQDKEICHIIMSKLHHYYLRLSTQCSPFNVYLLSKFDVSRFSVNGDIQIFESVTFLTLNSSKLIFIFRTLSKSKLTLVFTDFGQAIVILLNLGKTCQAIPWKSGLEGLKTKSLQLISSLYMLSFMPICNQFSQKFKMPANK